MAGTLTDLKSLKFLLTYYLLLTAYHLLLTTHLDRLEVLEVGGELLRGLPLVVEVNLAVEHLEM